MKSYREVLQARVPAGQRQSTRALVQFHGLPSPGSVSALIRKLEGGSAPPPPPVPPRIGVTTEGSGDSAVFVVAGSHFLPNRTVTVRFARIGDGQVHQVNVQNTSDGGGNFTLRQSIPCIRGLQISVSATDSRPSNEDLTGVLWSNTVTSACP
jgi:hypothetical protein